MVGENGSETFTTRNIIIATGSDVASLPGVEIDEERIVSSTGALSLTKVPKHLVVVEAVISASKWGLFGGDWDQR